MVLIDVGGPLLDEGAEYAAWDARLAALLREAGFAVGDDELAQAVAAATRRCDPHPRISALWQFVQPDLARFRSLVETFRDFQVRLSRERSPQVVRPGAAEVVAELSGRYQLALAGNQPASVRHLLARAGLLPFFRWTRVSEDMGVAKPDPLFFRMVLAGMSARPGEAVMVGDRLDHDVLPARLAGLWTIRALVGPYAQQVPPPPGIARTGR
ncbi:MAG: HAD family hydrolase [Candidatus Bipolaricaulaceae bacterium]